MANICFTAGEIPAEWRRGVIVLILKGDGDIHKQERQRGIRVLKLLERILHAQVRFVVDSKIEENHLGFR